MYSSNGVREERKKKNNNQTRDDYENDKADVIFWAHGKGKKKMSTYDLLSASFFFLKIVLAVRKLNW